MSAVDDTNRLDCVPPDIVLELAPDDLGRVEPVP
jgi:hypothetical protein